MNKLDLINAVSDETVLPKKDCEKVVNAVFDIILDELKNGNSISVTGFGSFEVKKTKEKEITSLKTKQKILIPSQNAIKFHLSKKAKEKVNC